jgi:TatD DNase family protein
MGGINIVDTHAHLSDPIFDHDLDEVLFRAKDAGVSLVIAVSENLSDAEKNIELAERHPAIRPAAGLYPAYLDMGKAEEMISWILKEQTKVYAIGEVGLDYWLVKKEEDKEIQREIFKRFIRLAANLDLPLNVHSRSAGHHAVTLLLEYNARKVQLHAFDGKKAAAIPAVEAGFLFSIPPSVVRSRQKQKLVRQLPLSSLLIETDSPVLGPSPDERNEPANAAIVINSIAEIKNVNRQKVIDETYANVRRLYGDLSK